MSDETLGASANERLIAAARSDNVDMWHEAVNGKSYDVNFQDGLGNTALHYACVSILRSTELSQILHHISLAWVPFYHGFFALHLPLSSAKYLSVDVIDLILEEEVDMDLQNFEGDTPLHLAVVNQRSGSEGKARQYVIEVLLEAGADVTILNKAGDTAKDLIHSSEREILKLFSDREAEMEEEKRASKPAVSTIDSRDIDVDDDGDYGSGSESE
ncbi:hypothetical protein AX16_007319 [Volvariella volvacea WC 439]|nr:hypothetical protein AX16_007319 [Volvariella volvacea WC 439]